jgi:hypothetical protein
MLYHYDPPDKNFWRNPHWNCIGATVRLVGRVLTVMFVVASMACPNHWFVYEIPNGYAGWANVSFGQADCKESSSTLLGNRIQVGANGNACSPQERQPQSMALHFYYVDGSGNRVRELKATGWDGSGMIWAASGSIDGSTSRFYVGNEQQFKASYKANRNSTAARQ